MSEVTLKFSDSELGRGEPGLYPEFLKQKKLPFPSQPLLFKPPVRKVKPDDAPRYGVSYRRIIERKGVDIRAASCRTTLGIRGGVLAADRKGEVASKATVGDRVQSQA